MIARRLRIGALVALIGALGGYTGWQAHARAGGCSAYVPVAQDLVAHAGGGLPDRTYANDEEALDLAARHGFRLVELDFRVRDGRLVIAHDAWSESSLSVPQLMAWLDRHPQVSVVTDVKTDNLEGLARLKRAAGARLPRFIPQIYHPAQHGPVLAMGYPAPILTIYRLGDERWIEAANALPLRAVTMPVAKRELAKRVRHKVYLHTVNEPMPGYGLYTDCLIPAGARPA